MLGIEGVWRAMRFKAAECASRQPNALGNLFLRAPLLASIHILSIRCASYL